MFTARYGLDLYVQFRLKNLKVNMLLNTENKPKLKTSDCKRGEIDICCLQIELCPSAVQRYNYNPHTHTHKHTHMLVDTEASYFTDCCVCVLQSLH